MDTRIQSNTNLVRRATYPIESTPPILSGSTNLNIENHKTFNHPQSLPSAKRSIVDLIFLPEIGLNILRYIPFKCIVKISALNKECRENYLGFFSPQIAKNDLKTNGKIIKNGELYFPIYLATFLASNKLDQRLFGLSFILTYLQELLHASTNIIWSTIYQTKEDLNGSFLRKIFIPNSKIKSILQSYQDICFLIWIQRIDTFYLEESTLIDINSKYSYRHLIKEIDKCIGDIKNLEERHISQKYFNKEYLLTSLLALSLIYFTYLEKDKFTYKTALLLFSTMIKGAYFEVNYRMPKALKRLEIKLNILKNALNAIDSKFKECDILAVRKAIIKFEIELLEVPESEKNEPKVNHSELNLLVKNKSNREKLLDIREKILVVVQEELALHNAARKIPPPPFFF